jgi:hypothetical protein
MSSSTLEAAPDLPRLPQMTSLVGGDDIEACRNTETNTADERVWESYAREIEIGLRKQKSPKVSLRRHEVGESLGQRSLRARSNLARRLSPRPPCRRRLEAAREQVTDQSRLYPARSELATRSRTSSRLLHRREIHVIPCCNVVKTFGNAPRSDLRLPDALFLSQPSHERMRIALSRVELIVQALQVRG